jgi:hypothetical protein
VIILVSIFRVGDLADCGESTGTRVQNEPAGVKRMLRGLYRGQSREKTEGEMKRRRRNRIKRGVEQ